MKNSNTIKFSIVKKSNKYIGIVESALGIIACNTPSSLKSDAIKLIERTASKLKIEEYYINSNSKYADIIFDIDENPKDNWNLVKSIDIDFQLYTPKQKQVVKTLLTVEPGKLISYGELAERSGIKNGGRFVGNCMASNYIPLIIPCHRVIKSNGKIGNYSGSDGIKAKIRYLRMEGAKNYRI